MLSFSGHGLPLSTLLSFLTASLHPHRGHEHSGRWGHVHEGACTQPTWPRVPGVQGGSCPLRALGGVCRRTWGRGPVLLLGTRQDVCEHLVAEGCGFPPAAPVPVPVGAGLERRVAAGAVRGVVVTLPPVPAGAAPRQRPLRGPAGWTQPHLAAGGALGGHTGRCRATGPGAGVPGPPAAPSPLPAPTSRPAWPLPALVPARELPGTGEGSTWGWHRPLRPEAPSPLPLCRAATSLTH